jgi:hypothetical protein
MFERLNVGGNSACPDRFLVDFVNDSRRFLDINVKQTTTASFQNSAVHF